MKPFLSLFTCATLCCAASTRTWTQSEYPEFEKGNLKDLSLRSDGRITIAPASSELFDSSSAYLWALAQDSHGNLYAGGGPGAKLFRISGSQSSTVAQFDALEIHAIAIDSKDRVYVATSPDGKIYRMSAAGKAEPFYDPKQKYIWGMAFDKKGDLYVATGDAGEVHRVTPDGKGSVFFKSEETHARSIAIDPHGSVIVGTEPSGLVLRISPQGEGFVLYQMAKREVTSVAVGSDGSIYAAGVGAKQSLPPVTAPAQPPPAPVAISMTAAGGAAAPAGGRPAAEPPPSFSPGARGAAVSGGSDVYRLHPSGYPEKLWSSSQDVVYTIAFDPQNRVLLGTGNKGVLYRIDSNVLYTALLHVSANQITGLQRGRDGALYAATGNVGKIYRVGPELEKSGSIESDVFDAGAFALWGRLSFEGAANGGSISLQTRTGNLDRPQKNWSAWSQPITGNAGARITSPPARFLQWKATLTSSAGHPPQLDSVDAAYLAQNIAPKVEEVEITPANYKYAAPVITLAPSTSINLPAIGHHAASSALAPDRSDPGASSMQYAKGWIGARWNASDENGDALEYTLQIRGVHEKEWKPLKDKLRERHYSFDSTAFPDGDYQLRVIASDAPGNTKEDALTAEQLSNPFQIDNTPPQITNLTGTRKLVRWKAADALSVIKKAEYSIDGADWTIVNPVTKLSDSPSLDYELILAALAPGEHTIAVRVTDDYDNQSVEKCVIK